MNSPTLDTKSEIDKHLVESETDSETSRQRDRQTDRQTERRRVIKRMRESKTL
jgi:hypothetical protein